MELTIKGKKEKVVRIAGVYIEDKPFVRAVTEKGAHRIEGDLFELGLAGIKKALK